MDDGERLAARGMPLTLADGETVMVRFGFDELEQLERLLGGLDNLKEEFNTRSVGVTLDALAIATGIPRDQIGARLDTRKVNDYTEVVGDALRQAFPPRSDDEEEAGGSPKVNGSHGAPSITSLPSSSGAATAISGP